MNLDTLKSAAYIAGRMFVGCFGVYFIAHKIRRYRSHRLRDKMFPKNKRRGPIKNLPEESSTWCWACAMLLAVVMSGCSTQKQEPTVQNRSLLPQGVPDPSDTNYWSTNAYNTPPFHPLIIDTNFMWLSCVTNDAPTITFTANNSTPGHTYDVFASTNGMPSGPRPTATNEFNWKFMDFFNGSTSPVNIGGIPRLNPFYSGLLVLTLDATSPPRSAFLIKPELALLTGRKPLPLRQHKELLIHNRRL